jgi:Ca-activated chloride channel family protein
MSSHALEPLVPAAASLVSVDGKAYPLESARLLARAEGGIATTTLKQTFANPHAEPLEVLYTLPLPADGAVLGYTIQIGEKTIRGEVQPREQAARAYKEALFAGRTAGLLEQRRSDTFEQRLGNVPPKTKVEVSIDVLHPLAFLASAGPTRAAGPEWEYRFPTVVGVRYHGAPGRVPDQQALSPDRGEPGDIPTQVELALTLAEAPGARAHSPSHSILCDTTGEGAVVRFAQGERLDRDVVVRWAAAAGEVGVRLVEGTGLPGDTGRYALVTVVPPAAPASTFARDLTVLIDASGSMSGLPLELAKGVVGDLLRSLAPSDRFELLAFANDVSRLTRALVPFDDKSLRAALDALDRLQAGGGTEMESAIADAMKPSRDDAQRQVVLVTDGQISFESEVVGRIAAGHNVRLHVVGIGHVPNRALTQQAAAAGRGLELLVATHESVHEAARRLVAGTAAPVVTQLAVSGTALTGHRPSRLRDVFAGQPLVFTVELSESGGTFELRGALAGIHEPWQHRIEVPATSGTLASTPLQLGALHGREVVGELELARTGSRDNMGAVLLDHEIETIAMRHRIVSRRTSLVAIAEEPSVDPRAPRRRERLVVELPAGVSAEGVGLVGAGELAKSMHILLAQEVMGMASAASFKAMRMYERESPTLDSLDIAPPRTGGARAAAGGPPYLSPLYVDHGLVATDVQWSEPDVIVVEFEVPYEGFELPLNHLKVRLVAPDGTARRVGSVVVPEQSSHAGPNPAGTIVRLAIRLAREQVLIVRATAGIDQISLSWLSISRDSKGVVHKLPMRLLFRAPDHSSERPA